MKNLFIHSDDDECVGMYRTSDWERCPFCGGKRLENLDDHDGAVHCVDCRARGPIPSSLERKLGFAVGDNFAAWIVRGGRKPQ